MSTQMHRPRCGISVIEVLAVISVIGILVGILIPAVQSARSAARQTQCKDNLRQLAIGVSAHESQKRVWPARLLSLLPHIEQAPAHGALLEWELKSIRDGSFGPKPSVSQIWLLKCPQDTTSADAAATATSYFVNDGTTLTTPSDGRKSNGVAPDFDIQFVPVPRAPSTVLDGLTTTAMFSERLLWRGVVSTSAGSTPPNPARRYAWRLDASPHDPAGFAEASVAQHTWSWPPEGRHARAMFAAEIDHYETWYDHALPPNSRPLYTRSQEFESYRSTRPATSQHEGGVHVAFCDGHVRFVSDKIDPGVWRSLGTRAGKEIVDDAAY